MLEQNFAHNQLTDSQILTSIFRAAFKQKDYKSCDSVLNQLITLEPRNKDFQKDLAVIKNLLGDYAESERVLKKIVTAKPDDLFAWKLLGQIQTRRGNPKEAIRSFLKVLNNDPNSFEANYNLGLAFRSAKMPFAAQKQFSKAIKLNDSLTAPFINRGLLHRENHDFNKAISDFDAALKLEPELAIARWNKALTYLLFGHYQKGWELYESRWQLDNYQNNNLNLASPLWLGDQSLHQKSILVHFEQGFGDTIQFVRYIPLLLNLGARVLLLVQPELRRLLRTTFVDENVIILTDHIPNFDFYIPLMSLPLAFRTTIENIPSANRYLRSEPKKIKAWRERLQHNRPNIGFFWRGNSNHIKDGSRSIQLEYFKPFLGGDFTCVIAQPSLLPDEARELAKHQNVLDCSQDIHDFLDTAALLENLDLVISVDTAAAHLAGALGIQTKLLLPFTPDFRWGLEGKNTPWYSSLEIFRQPKRECWNEVVAQALKIKTTC